MNDVDIRELQVYPPLPVAIPLDLRAAVRGKRDPLAVGRPGGPEVAAAPRRERCLPIGAQIANPQIRGAVGTGAYKSQLLSIRREIRLVIIRRVVGEPLESGSVRLDAIEVGR